VPYEFSRDTVDFMKSGRVDSASPDVIDALVNNATPATGAGSGAESSGKPAGLAK
jgi:hypothetical protein